MMCSLLDISRSGYYAWLSRPLCKTKQENIQLTEQISKIFEQSKCVYGAPRIRAALNADGQTCGKNRVARLMRYGL
jgi:putative transposase